MDTRHKITQTNLIYERSDIVQIKKKVIKKENQTPSMKIKELKLKIKKKVNWTEDTIDNEHMNKKKSKSN